MQPTGDPEPISLPKIALPEIEAWQALAVTAMLVMELTWGSVWFHALLSRGTQLPYGRVLGFLIAILFPAYLSVQLMNSLRLKAVVRRSVLLVYWLVAIVTGLRVLLYASEPPTLVQLVTRAVSAMQQFDQFFPREFVLILGVIFFSWRSIRLAQKATSTSLVKANVRFGFLMFLVYSFPVIVGIYSFPWLIWVIFLLASLFAMAAARLASLRYLRGSRLTSLGRGWVGGIALSILGTIMLAGGVAVLAAGFGPLLAAILVRLFIILFVLVVSPVVFLTLLALALISEWTRWGDSPVFQILVEGLDQIQQLLRRLAESFTALSWLGDALSDLWMRWVPTLKMLAYFGTLILLAAIILRQVQAWKHGKAAPDASLEEHESTAELIEKLLDEIRNRWRDLGSMLDPRNRLQGGRKRRLAARIRTIYLDLMDLAAELGHPRHEAQTPLEYLPDLQLVFPAFEPDVRQITRAYIRVRYGELPEGQEEVQSLEMAWSRIKEFGRKEQVARQRMRRASG